MSRRPMMSQKTNVRALKRELKCYKTFHRNVKAYFAAHPEIGEEFSLWMLAQTLLPPDGGRRVQKRRAA